MYIVLDKSITMNDYVVVAYDNSIEFEEGVIATKIRDKNNNDIQSFFEKKVDIRINNSDNPKIVQIIADDYTNRCYNFYFNLPIGYYNDLSINFHTNINTNINYNSNESYNDPYIINDTLNYIQQEVYNELNSFEIDISSVVFDNSFVITPHSNKLIIDSSSNFKKIDSGNIEYL